MNPIEIGLFSIYIYKLEWSANKKNETKQKIDSTIDIR